MAAKCYFGGLNTIQQQNKGQTEGTQNTATSESLLTLGASSKEPKN